MVIHLISAVSRIHIKNTFSVAYTDITNNVLEFLRVKYIVSKILCMRYAKVEHAIISKILFTKYGRP